MCFGFTSLSLSSIGVKKGGYHADAPAWYSPSFPGFTAGRMAHFGYNETCGFIITVQNPFVKRNFHLFSPGTPPSLSFFPFQNTLFFLQKSLKSSAPVEKAENTSYNMKWNTIKTHGGNLSNSSAPRTPTSSPAATCRKNRENHPRPFQRRLWKNQKPGAGATERKREKSRKALFLFQKTGNSRPREDGLAFFGGCFIKIAFVCT